jgi:hypothetical protein
VVLDAPALEVAIISVISVSFPGWSRYQIVPRVE